MLLIGDILRRNARVRPEKAAILFEEQVLSFGELNRRANALAHALIDLGVRRGDRVALLDRNCPEWVVAYYAAAKCGAILVPVSFWYRAGELAYAVNNSESCVLLAGERFGAVIAEVRPHVPSVQHYIWLRQRPPEAAPGDRTLLELVDGAPETEPQVALTETDPHIILYTSGTTGAPKGAVLSHRAHVLHAATFALYMRAVEEDVYLNVYPLFHTGGTDCAILPYHYVGATVGLLWEPRPDLILQAIERWRVTALMAVPTIWTRLLQELEHHRYDFSSLRRIMGSSDAMPRPLLERVVETFKVPWIQTYGLTEGGCILTYLEPPDQFRKIGSCGRPHVQCDLAVVDPNGNELPPGEIGEVVARTEHAMTAYWRNPQQTAEAFRGGWLHTGDLGRFDQEGYLYITGRLKDMIISGGEKIYPAEVEPVLLQHPAVKECAIIGVPDPEWGEAVMAVIVPRDGMTVNKVDIVQFVRERLAGYKRPRYVEVVEALPRTTATGKVQKAELRAHFGPLVQQGLCTPVGA
jgi:fatty-acyl-CoA synthase